MSVITINKDNFETEVSNSDKTVLLDFYADWCGPCHRVGAVIEEVAEKRNDIKVGKINVDEQPELADRFNVISIPMLTVMKNGIISNQSVGYRSKKQILELL